MSLVEDLQQCEFQGKKCERYNLFIPKEKVQIGKWAAERGVTATIWHYSKMFSGCSLKESCVRT